ncbi:MAG: DUF5004 domain-containing protein [Ferruginibacter sp.]|nr:DUF5004 domain-containing protein [Ferruginibacter sp.]
MKKLIVTSFLILVFATIFISSCKKIEYVAIGESISLQKNLIGNWKLDSIVQVDQNAVDKAFPAFVQKLNITGFFPYNTVSVAFTDGGGGTTGNYTFANPGNAPLFFAGSGNWAFIENGGPLRIRLSSGSRADTIDFAKAHRITDNKLDLRYRRAFYTGTKKVFVYYDLNFSKN